MSTSKKTFAYGKNSAGFTLIEVLVSVSIFATSLVALLLVVGTGIGDINVAKDRLTANYLAQEGLEIMRYKRDYDAETAGTAAAGWTNFATEMNACTTQYSCGVSALDITNPPVACVASNTGNTCDIVQDTGGLTATGAYTLLNDEPTWTPTIYSRYVYVTAALPQSNDAYIIHSAVKWTAGTGSYETDMSETIYNWK